MTESSRKEQAEVFGLIDTVWGLTLLAHEKHGGKFRDFDRCTAPWCVRGHSVVAKLKERFEVTTDWSVQP